MVSRLQTRLALRRKLQILRSLTCSKSVKKSCIIADAVLYIYNLKLQLETIKRDLSNFDDAIKTTQHFNFMNQIQFPNKKEVKVEKGEKGIEVRVKCSKGKDNNMVGILEVFENMGLMVLNAKVSCDLYFHMEAIVVPDVQHIQNVAIDLNIVAQAILQSIEKDM